MGMARIAHDIPALPHDVTQKKSAIFSAPKNKIAVPPTRNIYAGGSSAPTAFGHEISITTAGVVVLKQFAAFAPNISGGRPWMSISTFPARLCRMRSAFRGRRLNAGYKFMAAQSKRPVAKVTHGNSIFPTWCALPLIIGCYLVPIKSRYPASNAARGFAV